MEAKTSPTPMPGMAAYIESFRRDLGKKAALGYVVHPGDVQLPLGKDAQALPFACL